MKMYEFKFKGYIFRSIDELDIEVIRQWRNEDTIRSQFLYSEKISYDEQVGWYKKYSRLDNDIMFMVSDESNASKIAVGALYNIDEISTEFGRLMVGNDKYRGRGLGKIILEGLTWFAFNQLKLERIYLEVFNDNLPALKSYEKVGFKRCEKDRLFNGRALVKMEKLKSEV